MLKEDGRCHDIRWYRLQFLQTLVLILPWKSAHVKIHTKMSSFWLVFSAKNPVKSDKLALIIEGKILNLMFLAIYIPVVPFENWLRITHSPFINSCLNFFKNSNSHYSASSTTEITTSRQRPVFWATDEKVRNSFEVWSVWRVDDWSWQSCVDCVPFMLLQ